MSLRLLAVLTAGFMVTFAYGGPAFAADDKPAQRMVEPLTPMDYFKEAALADMLEVQASKIALKRAQSGKVRAFAQKMIQDHSKSTEMLKKAAEESLTADTKLGAPAAMNESQRALLRKLESADAGDFDRTYVDMQIEAHQKALNLHRSYAETGTNTDLRQAAAKIAATVEGHLQTLQDMASASGSVR